MKRRKRFESVDGDIPTQLSRADHATGEDTSDMEKDTRGENIAESVTAGLPRLIPRVPNADDAPHTHSPNPELKRFIQLN